MYNLNDAAKSCIKLGENVPKVFHCNIGVRQGENLSPVLAKSKAHRITVNVHSPLAVKNTFNVMVNYRNFVVILQNSVR